jgi:hypothetical protein
MAQLRAHIRREKPIRMYDGGGAECKVFQPGTMSRGGQHTMERTLQKL